MFNLPLLLLGGVARMLMAHGGSSSGSGGGSGSGVPLSCRIYAVPEDELEVFLSAHGPTLHYTAYARKLAEAGHHAFSCEITAKGQEMMRRFDGERVVVCTDFE